MEYILNKINPRIRSHATPEVEEDKVHMKAKAEIGKEILKKKNKEKKNAIDNKNRKSKELKIEAERYQNVNEESHTGVFLDKKK